MHDVIESREVPIVGCQATRKLPDAFDGIELGAVWWQEQQREPIAVLVQPRLECAGVVVLGVVQH